MLQRYIPAGGYNQYAVERQADGAYKVINHSNYANGSDNIYYTQRNEGRFVVVESRAPSGYYGDWTDVTKPGAVGSVLGKRAYSQAAEAIFRGFLCHQGPRYRSDVFVV